MRQIGLYAGIALLFTSFATTVVAAPLGDRAPASQTAFLQGNAATGTAEKPVTWSEFHRNFQFGLHCTLYTHPSPVTWNPTMHYTGPDSPFVQYVREMRTYGFGGLFLQLRRPEAYIPEKDSQGKWCIPAENMRQIHEAVDIATQAGYWLIIQVNPIKYEDLRDTRPGAWATDEQRYTDDWIQMDYDIWEQVIREFKSYRNIGYQTNNEFHGYKWEQALPPNHPRYLTAEQATAKFMDYITHKGVLAHTIKPTAWVFYRNRGQMVMEAQTWKFPFGIDRPPTEEPCYYAFAHNFNLGDFNWGYYGLNHPQYTEEYMKWERLNRKTAPGKESAGLLTEYRNTKWKGMGALAERFGMEYHVARVKTCKKFMTDYQNLAQMEFLMDYFNKDKSLTCYADGDTSGGNKQNGLFNTKKNRAHAYNAPCIDQFLNLNLEKSHSRQLKLETTDGGTIEHQLGPLHRGTYMVRIGDRIALQARPKEGYQFAGWTGSVRGNANPVTVAVPDSHGVICATFSKPGQAAPVKEVYTLKRHWDAFEAVDYTFADKAKPADNFAHVVNPLYRPLNARDPKDAAAEKQVFLKFKVDKVPSDRSCIAYATIKFRNFPKEETKRALRPTIAAYATDPSWDGTRVTWNNRPKRDGNPVGVEDYWIFQEQIHLEITDYIKNRGAGLHSFTFIAAQDQTYGQDIEIIASRELNAVKTYDKPLLYVVWDEKVPVVPWETQKGR